MNKLVFKEEAAKHIARLPELRSAVDCELLNSYKIDCANADAFIVIPCHVKEQGLYESLMAYIDSGVDEKFLFIIYLNANATTTSAEFKKLLKQRQKDIKRAQKDFARLRIQTFAHHFADQAIISRIRGIITDALIRSCLEQEIEDPILISNDADALYYSQDYLQNLRNRFRATTIDFASGTIYWTGCDKSGRVLYSPQTPLPELFLNELFAQKGDDIYREHGTIYTTGCNSAFRLSTLAAIGSYDYDFAPFFDVEIGNVLKEYRGDSSCAAFFSDCALSTNPRRAMHALLNRVPYGQQFGTVGKILGADMSIFDYIQTYLESSEFIQSSELLSYADDSESNRKVQQRITAAYLNFLQGEPTSNKLVFTKFLCPRVGLTISRIQLRDDDHEQEESMEATHQVLEGPFDAGNDAEENVNNNYRIENIEFDWTQSRLPHVLISWLKLIQVQ